MQDMQVKPQLMEVRKEKAKSRQFTMHRIFLVDHLSQYHFMKCHFIVDFVVSVLVL